jgi:tripartite-type tricarboxylate transporter receptor subunit TctC
VKLPRRSFLHLTFGAVTLSTVSRIAKAQTFPTRPVRLIVPVAAGGPADVLARLYAQKLTLRWNQPVVVENRAGATGTIGTEVVAKAPPDGYTLLFTVDLPITMAPVLLKPRYDSQRDLIPIAAVATSENLLVVTASTGIRSLADLVATAKANPGALTFASAGIASPAHLCGEMLKQQAGIEMTHVPFPGAAPALNSVLSGAVNMFCGPIALEMSHVKSGKLNALGVTGTAPSRLAPELPPIAASYPGLVISNWFALFAPVGTSADVTNFLRDELDAVYRDDELQGKLTVMGLDPVWQSSTGLTEAIKKDSTKWMEFIKATKIKAD